jgi:hypothetical protein
MPLNITVNKRGEKNITIGTGGNEKQKCAVMLCGTENGGKCKGLKSPDGWTSHW